ncbi:hypothetical protein CEE36_10555 [candidate division TA06 bacterium B3_TA06]|uniref:PEGA domain-containing protein n=1 Tax=candidate division TA06 bacterium B3_TA06 TaxID=2012487 RepID=A0A532UVP2_UNCT6|nr:MAG: hypothetical protein CEE36_10555 [candidate division TA06 bacterium B3_TA06]
MLKKLVLVGFALVVFVGLTGCEELADWLLGGTTGVEGKLELAAGVEGDLDDTKVYLYDNPDFEGDYEEKASADEYEDDDTKATFEFEDIDEDDYYLLAWKDLDDDDEISYGDPVGIYDGKYGEDEPEEIDVDEGEMTDVGTIKMYIYEGATTGSIQVNSIPTGATIYLDGSSTGKTTDALLENVSEGSHTVKLVKSDYEDWQQSVNVTAGQTTTIDAALIPEGGGDITSISISGTIEDYLGVNDYVLEVYFSYDTELGSDDEWDNTDVGTSFSNVTFSVPSAYQSGCYVIIVGWTCYDYYGDGGYDMVFGFHGDTGGENPTYQALQLQSSYSGIYLDAYWIIDDGCEAALKAPDVVRSSGWNRLTR